MKVRKCYKLPTLEQLGAVLVVLNRVDERVLPFHSNRLVAGPKALYKITCKAVGSAPAFCFGVVFDPATSKVIQVAPDYHKWMGWSFELVEEICKSQRWQLNKVSLEDVLKLEADIKSHYAKKRKVLFGNRKGQIWMM